jgi:hypothetical protein
MEKKVLTQEELNNLKQFQSREENLIVAFGQMAYQRQNLDEQEEKLIEEKAKFEKERSELASSLTEKYGNGTINIDTGEITPVE